MNRVVVDTHALLWFLTDSPHLSKQAREDLEHLLAYPRSIVIPTILLAEFLYMSQKKRLPLVFEEVLGRFEREDVFYILPLTLEVVRGMSKLATSLSLHDRVFVASANYLNCPLITKDEVIRDSQCVHTIW